MSHPKSNPLLLAKYTHHARTTSVGHGSESFSAFPSSECRVEEEADSQATVAMKFARLSTALLSLPLLGACATMEIPEYQPPTVFEETRTEAGLELAVHPILEQAEAEANFAMPLLQEGVLALYIEAENRHPTANYLLLETEFELLSGDTLESQSAGFLSSGQSGGGAAAAMTGALLINAPLLFLGAKAMSDATVVRHNLVDKGFFSHTLAPGQRARGFVYFQLGTEEPLPLARTFLCRFRDPSSREEHQILIPLTVQPR